MIELQNVTKKYNDFTAVDDISFKIDDGEVVGFLGPNGAGKSTTMNMITGYIEPTAGKIIVNGFDINQKSKQAKKQIGYMPENVPLYLELTVKEFISYMADLKLVKRKEKKEEIERVLKATGLEEVKGKLIRNLSRGYRQRVSLAGALVGNPPILILDEPTVGLDPIQVKEIRTLIKELGKKHTILISSHILAEISQMCNKIIIINKGKIMRTDKMSNIEEEVASKETEVTLTVEETDVKLSEIKDDSVVVEKTIDDNTSTEEIASDFVVMAVGARKNLPELSDCPLPLHYIGDCAGERPSNIEHAIKSAYDVACEI